MLWGILGAFAGFVVFAILFQQLKPVHSIPDAKAPLDFSSRDIYEASRPDIAKEA